MLQVDPDRGDESGGGVRQAELPQGVRQGDRGQDLDPGNSPRHSRVGLSGLNLHWCNDACISIMLHSNIGVLLNET